MKTMVVEGNETICNKNLHQQWRKKTNKRNKKERQISNGD